MNRSISLGLLLLLILGAPLVFTEDTVRFSEPMEFLPLATYAQATSTDASIPSNIRNNRYFVESVRLTNLAQQSLE